MDADLINAGEVYPDQYLPVINLCIHKIIKSSEDVYLTLFLNQNYEWMKRAFLLKCDFPYICFFCMVKTHLDE